MSTGSKTEEYNNDFRLINLTWKAKNIVDCIDGLSLILYNIFLPMFSITTMMEFELLFLFPFCVSSGHDSSSLSRTGSELFIFVSIVSWEKDVVQNQRQTINTVYYILCLPSKIYKSKIIIVFFSFASGLPFP
jgi:hypothetical protein